MKKSWEYAERTKLMNPIDDEFFRKMAEDVEFCQEILQVILEDHELTVEEVIPQNAIKNLQGRSVVVDALCRMQGGHYCHVEVQKSNDDDHKRRVRYNSSCITANISREKEPHRHAGKHCYSGRKREQPQKYQRHCPSGQADGCDGAFRKRKVESCLRHALCRGPAPLCGEPELLCPHVPGSDGQTGCGFH